MTATASLYWRNFVEVVDGRGIDNLPQRKAMMERVSFEAFDRCW
jgi:hypothetical protein